jgi:hypothetical protein
MSRIVDANNDARTRITSGSVNNTDQLNKTGSRSLHASSFADSGYQSRVETDANTTTSVPDVTNRRPPAMGSPIPGTNLFFFRIHPSAASIEHYNNIRSLIEAHVQKAVASVERDPKHLGVRRKMIGTDEATANLHVVVFCAHHLEDVVNEVFAREWLRNLLNHDQSMQPLGVLVIPDPPKQVNASLDIDVCYRNTYTIEKRTYCGAPIIMRGYSGASKQRQTRQATFGGMIKVVYGDGGTRFYGMTAGHTVQELQHTPTTSETLVEDSCLEGRDAFDLADWISDGGVLGHILDSQRLPGVSANRARLSHDWALFGVQMPLRNLAGHDINDNGNDGSASTSYAILTAQKLHSKDDLSAPVRLLGAAGGNRRGELSDESARIWLAHSDCFVDAYMLELAEGTGKPTKAAFLNII